MSTNQNAGPMPTDAPTKRREFLALSVAAGLFGPTAYAQAPAFSADRLQALEAQLRNAPNVRAFLMERRGAPFAYYRQDTTSATRLNVASVTKSVLALLVGIAIGQGAIASVDEPLAAFFPEHAQGPNAAVLQRVTLRHLLTLSPGFDRGGLDANTDYPDFVRRFFAPGFVPHALGRPLAHEPGTRFQYSNVDSHLVAEALSRRLKVPLAVFAQAELFEPLGIDGAEWPTGQDGVPNGAAELRLTAPDLLRIGQLMRAGGQWQGRQIVPAAFVKEATTRHVDTGQPARGPKELWGYGYLWWLSSTQGENLPAFYAAGYGGQFIYVVPALDLVVVALTDQVSREVAGRTAALIREFALPAVVR